MFEIGFCTLIAFFVISFTVAMIHDMDENSSFTELVAGIGYTGLAIGFICAIVERFITM